MRPRIGRCTVPGKASLISDGALNGEHCQLIEADGGETGVQQKPLCVRKDDSLSGSLWARGNAPEGLVVRLLDGDKKLAEQTLPAPGEQWKELPIELKIPAAAENATLQVGVRGKGKVWIDQVSLMPASARQTGGFRPDLLKAVAELRPPIIRWPGGCYAEHYRWQHGVGPQHKRIAFPISMWDDRDVNSYGTDEFIAMCRKIGSEPLLVINIGRHDKPEKRADVHRRGLRVDRILQRPGDLEVGQPACSQRTSRAVQRQVLGDRQRDLGHGRGEATRPPYASSPRP